MSTGVRETVPKASERSRAATTATRERMQAVPLATAGTTRPAPAACACGGTCPRCHAPLQAKLLVGANHDPLEQEADRVAEHIIAGPANLEVRHTPPRIQRAATAAAGISGVAPRSVDHVLAGGGSPLPAPVQNEMSQRFGHDFSDVRIHTGSLAADSAKETQARAYTVGSHIVFGAGNYAPDARPGKQLLAHELTHVVQQSGANTAYVARSVEDWLTGSVNITAMSYTQLLAEADELAQYLDRQTSSSPETVQIEAALASVRAEVNRRDTAAAGPRSRSRSTRTTGAATPLPPRYPRILLEMTSVVYADPEEMRAEYDLIMQWLTRDEISRNERRILTGERDNLAPQLRSDRDRVVAERHAARVATALTPAAEDESRALETLARTIQGIAQDPGRREVFYIYHQGERIAISRDQATQLRANLMRELGRAVRGIEGRAQYYWDRYNSQLSINRDSPIISAIAGWRVEDPGDELRSRYFWVYHRIRAIETQLRADRPVEAAAMLAPVEFVGQEIRQLSRGFYEGHIEGAETAVSVLEFTRDASFAVAGSIAAVVAAPVVAGFVGAGGLGLTGAGAAVATTGGTALVVGTGTAVVRGGSAATGEAAAGGSLEQVGSAFWGEAVRGFREGFINGGAGAAARLLGPALGVGTSLGQQALRRIAAEAIVNGTTGMVDVLWQGGTLEAAVAAGLRSAVLSVPSALIGGSNNPIVRNLVAPLTAGGTAYLGARAAGASPQQAMQAAGVAVATSIAMSRSSHSADADAALVETGRSMGASTRATAVDATRRVASLGAAVMIGTSSAVPPLRSGYGGTSVSMPGDVSSMPVSNSTSSMTAGDVPDVMPGSTVHPVDVDAAPTVAPVSTADAAPLAPVSTADTATPVTTAPAADTDATVGTPTPAVADAEPSPLATVPPVDATPVSSADSTPATTSPVDDLNVDAAIAPGAAMEVSPISMTGRTVASGRSRTFASLTRLVLSATQRLAAIRLHGQLFGSGLRQAWTQTRNAREVADLQAITNHWNAGRQTEARVLARAAFDRHRTRFWRAVRADPSLQAIFTDAGMVFPPGNGAPIYRDPVTGDQLDLMTLEHQTRLADDPARALDAGNLQTVLGDENSVTLEWIRRNDPFQ